MVFLTFVFCCCGSVLWLSMLLWPGRFFCLPFELKAKLCHYVHCLFKNFERRIDDKRHCFAKRDCLKLQQVRDLFFERQFGKFLSIFGFTVSCLSSRFFLLFFGHDGYFPTSFYFSLACKPFVVPLSVFCKIFGFGRSLGRQYARAVRYGHRAKMNVVLRFANTVKSLTETLHCVNK